MDQVSTSWANVPSPARTGPPLRLFNSSFALSRVFPTRKRSRTPWRSWCSSQSTSWGSLSTGSSFTPGPSVNLKPRTTPPLQKEPEPKLVPRLFHRPARRCESLGMRLPRAQPSKVFNLLLLLASTKSWSRWWNAVQRSDSWYFWRFEP